MKKNISLALILIQVVTLACTAQAEAYTYDGVEVPLEASPLDGRFYSFFNEQDFISFQRLGLDEEVNPGILPTIVDIFVEAYGAGSYRYWNGEHMQRISRHFPLVSVVEFAMGEDEHICAFLAKGQEIWCFAFSGANKQNPVEKQNFQENALVYLEQVKPLR